MNIIKDGNTNMIHPHLTIPFVCGVCECAFEAAYGEYTVKRVVEPAGRDIYGLLSRGGYSNVYDAICPYCGYSISREVKPCSTTDN